jgi:hypothetical protein
MKANPRGDWTIRDVESLCRGFGIACKAPTRGAHYALTHADGPGRLSIPARRPIKAIYIQLLIDMIDSLESR